MTLLYLDDRFTLHKTRTHPESAKRLIAIHAELAKQAITPSAIRPDWVAASREQLLRVHSEQYIDSVEAFANQGGGWIEQDTIVSPESYRVATLASGAATDAVRRVLAGESKSAFCAIRPPGHHALSKQAMGFCLLNHVAIAARTACHEYGIDRVLIVDWDVHHGNGTQAIFWEDPRVGFFSIHRWPFYPGTGAASETGSGQGLGTTLNVPIEYGTPVKEYHLRFAQALHTIANRSSS
jgi:acetoin utilization deacetylase AcuC-like enzyme